MTRRTAYLLAVATLVAGAFVLSGVRVLMVIGGLPLALLLPGLAMSAALFRRPGRLLTVERIMLVPALSLATLILGGLLAWAVRVPLHRPAWLALSVTVTLAGLLLGTRKNPSRVRGGQTTRTRLLTQALPAVLSVALLAGAAWLSLGTSLATHRATVTTLSVVPPGAADATGTRAVQITATGLSTGAAYTLQVTGTATATSRTALTGDENGLWTSTLRLPGDDRLTLALYQAGSSLPLRTVILASAATG